MWSSRTWQHSVNILGWFYEELQDLLELTTKKGVLFITGYQNAKVGSQEIPGVTGKFGPRIQNEEGKRLTEFFQESTLIIESTLFHKHKRQLYTWTSPVNTKIRMIIFFTDKDGQALYGQQKQDRELAVAQIMSSLLQNSCLN